MGSSETEDEFVLELEDGFSLETEDEDVCSWLWLVETLETGLLLPPAHPHNAKEDKTSTNPALLRCIGNSFR